MVRPARVRRVGGRARHADPAASGYLAGRLLPRTRHRANVRGGVPVRLVLGGHVGVVLADVRARGGSSAVPRPIVPGDPTEALDASGPEHGVRRGVLAAGRGDRHRGGARRGQGRTGVVAERGGERVPLRARGRVRREIGGEGSTPRREKSQPRRGVSRVRRRVGQIVPPVLRRRRPHERPGQAHRAHRAQVAVLPDFEHGDVAFRHAGRDDGMRR